MCCLGDQLRTAIEVFIRALDRWDHDSQGALLHEVSHREVYKGGLTVLWRRVFLFTVEQQGLQLPCAQV